MKDLFAPYPAVRAVEAPELIARCVRAFADDDAACAKSAAALGVVLRQGSAFDAGRSAMNLKLRAEQLGFDARVLQQLDREALAKTLSEKSEIVFVVAVAPKGTFAPAARRADSLENVVSGI